MLDRCDRVQIAVHDAAKAAQRFGQLLGAQVARRDHSRHLAAKRTILAVGESEFELCEADGAGLTQDFVAKRGELTTVPAVVAFPNQHYNGVTSWSVYASGEVKHVYA